MEPCVQRDRGQRRGYWRPLREAVEAMALHDTLIWDVPIERQNSARTRLNNCRHSEFHIKWLCYGSKMFIIRVK